MVATDWRYLLAAAVVLGSVVAFISARMSQLQAEARIRQDENGRLWALIQSMRAVTIEPARLAEVTQDLVRESPAAPFTPSEPEDEFRRSTEHVVYRDDEEDELKERDV
jgi:hypothetical protein